MTRSVEVECDLKQKIIEYESFVIVLNANEQ